MRWIQMMVTALLFAVVPGTLVAEETGPQRVSVITIEVKPGTQGVFETFVKKFKAAADSVENAPNWFASSPGIGSNTTYTFAQPFVSYAELFQDRNILAEVYEPAEIEEIMAMARSSMLSSDSAVYVHRPDLSRSFPETDKPPVVTLFIGFQIHEGKSGQFENFLRRVVEATDKVAPDLHWESYMGAIAADLDYGVRIPMWDAADLDVQPMGVKERLVEAFGKREGERLFESGQAAIDHVQDGVSRMRPDLSHVNSAE